MKAIQFDRLGGPEVMQLREVPAPELIPGTVLVRNHVIALNFGDTVFIRGRDRGAAADGEILPMP